MPSHRFFQPAAAPLARGTLVIGGEEARHAARVKRVAPGETVDVLDGAGGVATGMVARVERVRGEWTVRVDLASVTHVLPVSPGVVVLAPAPKGDRLVQMIEGLSQVGAAAWRPLVTERTVAEAGAGKIERLKRIAQESAKQCGRAWALRIEPSMSLAEGLRLQPLVIADAGGAALPPVTAPLVHVLIGPEGGWSERERDAARAARAIVASFGPHVLRVETAAVVAASTVLNVAR